MKKNLVKRIISGMSAMAIVASVMPTIPVSAYGNVVTPNKYKTLLNDTNSDNIIEKTVDLYYLPAWHGDGQTEYRNWTMPASLPTSYNIPEWNSYTWQSTSAGVINRDTYKASGSVVVNSFDTTKWTNSDCFEDTCVLDIFGINNDSQIHYTFNIHNYAYTLREQEMDRLIAKYITPDMTDYEKVCKVIDIVAAGTYWSGDPILTKSGDCIDAANAVVYLLRKLGIKARMRRCVDDMFSGSNHYNNYVIIDGELYIIDATCQFTDTSFTYEERIAKMPEKRASWEEAYIRKADSWEGLINGAGLTDGKYVYKKLDDGTLALYDIVGLDGDTSATWTVPTTATINGTTYTVSTIGNIGNQTYQCTQADLCENGRYGESYWYNTPYKQIIMPEGIKLSDEKSNLTNCFDNVEQITTNSSTTNLYNKFESYEDVLVIDGSNSTLKDVPYNAKTVYTNVTSELENYRIDVTGGYETEMPLCNVSDPNTRTLTGTVDIEVHNSNITLTNESGAIYYPILESDFKSFRFLGIPQGKYTFKVSIDGYNDYVQEVTVSNSNISFGYIIPDEKSYDTEPVKTDVSNCTVSLSTASYVYDGAAKTPAVTVKDGSKTLVNGTDYTVAYSGNVNAGTATATITGKGDYTGTVSKTYTISKANISDFSVTLSQTSYEYDGTAKKPSVTVKNDTKTLASGTDYTIAYSNNVNAGTATVTVSGIGNYTGSVSKTYTISNKEVPPQSIENATITLSSDSFVYDGTAKTPAVTVTYGTKTLVPNTDYTTAYSSNINAGTATVTITGKGAYAGSVSKTFTINKASITGFTVTLSQTDYEYDGTAKKPTVTVKNGTKTLTNGTDYTVSYSGNVNAGTATVTVNGIGNYTGIISKNFTISQPEPKTCDIADTSITLSASSFVYDGTAKTPTVTVKDGTKTLTKDTDYTISYSSNVNVGTATVAITGKGGYEGIVTKNFTIKPANVSSCTVTLSASSYTYNGTAKKPAVTVKNGSTTLKNGTDYSTIYTNNVNAGTATVKITGRGNYTGTATKTYTISKANITNCTVKLSATSFVYDGSNKKPSVTVKNGSTVLKSGTDYSVTYTSCKNVGSAKVTISGKGNYANSIAKSYIIRPGNVANPKATTTTNTTATLAWDKMAGADGYYVYQYNPSTSKWNKKATTKQNTYKVTGLAAGTTYKFYVKAYKKISNSTYVSSSYTQIGTSTIPAKVNFTLTAGKNKATLKWKKQAGVTGYKIYYKASKNASWKGLAAPAKATTSYTKKGLKSGQTYYFAFRSYRVVNGKTYNGTLNWKTVKVK